MIAPLLAIEVALVAAAFADLDPKMLAEPEFPLSDSQ